MKAKMRTSARLDRVKPSITMAVTAKAAELKARGLDVISFGAGEPDFDTPEHIKDAVRHGLESGNVGKYTHVMGTAALRSAVAQDLSQTHGTDITSEQVIVDCGAKHSLFNICMAMLDDGDEVIIPAPYWVSYPDMVKLAGGEPVIVETKASNGFALDPAALAAAITPKTRALVLNTPSNPTGALYTRAQLEALADVVLEHGIWVISDDIYRSLVYGDAEYVSFASLSAATAAHTILVDGVSKTYAMTGYRIGYCAGPVELVKAMAKLQGQSTSGPSHVAQVAALAAITGSQECVAQMRVAFDERRKAMVELLNAIPDVRCREPNGAFYAFPDVSSYLGKKTASGDIIGSDVKLCEYLVEQGQVAIVPGSGFGAPGFARLSYACSMDDIRSGLARMREALVALE